MHRGGIKERGEISGGLDTWCSFTAAHQVEARCINDARLASPGQVHLKCHLKKHKCRVNAMLVELEQLTKVVQTLLSCKETSIVKYYRDSLACVMRLPCWRVISLESFPRPWWNPLPLRGCFEPTPTESLY